MHGRTRRPTWISRALLAIVAIALVTAQTAGLHHRIEHRTENGWLDDVPAQVASTDSYATGAQDSHDGVQHDCAALDALALGDGPPRAIAAAAVAPVAPEQTAHFQYALRESARIAPFQARAPPTLIS